MGATSISGYGIIVSFKSVDDANYNKNEANWLVLQFCQFVGFIMDSIHTIGRFKVVSVDLQQVTQPYE